MRGHFVALPYLTRPINGSVRVVPVLFRRCRPFASAELIARKALRTSASHLIANRGETDCLFLLLYPSPCRITNIDPNNVMILPHDANLRRMEFSETTGQGVQAVLRLIERIPELHHRFGNLLWVLNRYVSGAVSARLRGKRSQRP
jgi:hypothetical protein